VRIEVNMAARVRRPVLLALAAATLVLAGCEAVIIGGAVLGGGLVATDRRTTGAQLEDQGIELKAAARIRDAATLGNVNATSYNRLVLLTGEVPGEAEKAKAEQAALQVENVRGVVDELAVAGNSSMGSRSSDTLLSTKVKATFVDDKQLQANAFKVVAERGNIYLMGRVSAAEASRAADLASRVPGVQKVVRVVEVLSDAEAAAIQRQTAPR
jgi:osmotically-inducible protein OsmY